MLDSVEMIGTPLTCPIIRDSLRSSDVLEERSYGEMLIKYVLKCLIYTDAKLIFVS